MNVILEGASATDLSADRPACCGQAGKIHKQGVLQKQLVCRIRVGVTGVAQGVDARKGNYQNLELRF